MIQETFLEQLPMAAFEISNGTVTAVNSAAGSQMPELIPGSSIPDFLFQAQSADTQYSQFHYKNQLYLLTRLNIPQHDIVMFAPFREDNLPVLQMDGFSRQIREYLAQFFNQVELLSQHISEPQQIIEDLKGFNHTLHQMLRLTNNLQFLSIPDQEAELLFCPVIMDLAGLCADISRQAAPLLRQAKVELAYSSSITGLLTSGDPTLLQRALLNLLSNAAKFSEGKTISLKLHQNYHKAILTITDGNPDYVDPSSLLSMDPNAIPQPCQGAGLGLSVAQRIIQLHNGTLLYHNDPSGGLVFVIALPLDIASTSLSVRTPLMEENAGLSPLLVELADVLPQSVFDLELEPMD